ncbi:SDR family NAD(P)-dependent oxidoreductase [Gordonia sp. MP11Mi]|uniref:Oxidoreductase EphD n=1 Tax=Gordonia sp. MP11Mi TaxID=3022769 RepID=A0AA97D066_9ACTN
MVENNLEGDVVVITGAGSGIGRATAIAFAECGAQVVATDRDLESVTETAALCAPVGTCAPDLLDVTDANQWARVLNDVTESYGPIRVLVNNAGYTTAGRFLDHTGEDWSALVAVNVRGVVTGSRLAAQHMITEGTAGQIINISSAAAYTPITVSSPYCTTKAAVLMFSETLRAELRPHRIGVTAICPGAIDTRFYNSAQYVGSALDRTNERRDLSVGLIARFGSGPDTVAAAIVRSVSTNRAVQPVTAESYLGYIVSRLSPTAMKAVARLSGEGALQRIEHTSFPHRLRGRFSASKGPGLR